jgi:hypothetical protein
MSRHWRHAGKSGSVELGLKLPQGTYKDTSSFHTGSEGDALPNPNALNGLAILSATSCFGVDAPLPEPPTLLTFLLLFVRLAASANARLIELIPRDGPYEFVRGKFGFPLALPAADPAELPGVMLLAGAPVLLVANGGRETNSFCSN